MDDPTQVHMLCMEEDKRCRVNPLARSSSFGGGYEFDMYIVMIFLIHLKLIHFIYALTMLIIH